MALTFYLDGSDDPVVNADAYVTQAEANLLLAFTPAWQVLTSDQKDDKIKQASALIDSLHYAGAPVSTDGAVQTLQFPRNFLTLTATLPGMAEEFCVSEQRRSLRRAVCAQIEYNLNRQGLGALQFSRGDLSATPSQETLCRPAKMALAKFML